MKKEAVTKFIAGLVLCLSVTFAIGKISDQIEPHNQLTQTKTKQLKKGSRQVQVKHRKKTKKSVMRRPINWKKSSETVAYPELAKIDDFWIHVSTGKSRVFLMSGSKKIYTMYASTGAGGEQATPKGTWYIQPEKGDFFYNGQSGEGAKYWVSFKGHGVYLFHSVPTDQKGKFIKKETEELGRKANSHGCVRLSVPDARWMYHNLQTDTKVVID
ncbi:L,D-transpeptidase [Ligilactobacillus acidipiscis]|uniref:L,D-transpeptidase n=1 Tax=Ligilactobacillus acidipiscis TaxID=89059 RepID=UPI002FD8F59F